MKEVWFAVPNKDRCKYAQPFVYTCRNVTSARNFSVGYGQSKKLIAELVDIDEVNRVLVAALNKIASWGEGADVSTSFDEPNSAETARSALIAWAGTKLEPAKGGDN